MLRYIKIRNKYIDTLEALKNGICYLVIGKHVYDVYTDIKIGRIQGEKDVLSENDKLY